MSSTTTNSPEPLPNPRLVRNGYNADGLSVFTHDAALPTYTPFGPHGSAFAIFDRRDAVPVDNSLDLVPVFGEALPRCAPGGVLFCITDIRPQARVPMHRTLSLDYCCVLAGEVGANHSWFNASGEVCRILCSLVGAEKVQLPGGRVFEETAFKGLSK
ncbi:hypothetical protein LLEC1_05994 [Akanthomyces lecanii]|uniref:Uncharacterized protein n=1 Tax=Cordyceps confragosa TaxID=2714763 RepID=A0A179IBT5_CORDF|nr:hypothetical protein LLEC1_05994 [Akanthomyces lecanii]